MFIGFKLGGFKILDLQEGIVLISHHHIVFLDAVLSHHVCLLVQLQLLFNHRPLLLANGRSVGLSEPIYVLEFVDLNSFEFGLYWLQSRNLFFKINSVVEAAVFFLHKFNIELHM